MNKKMLYNISYGMYIVGSIKDDKPNVQIANTVFQITSEPATLAVSINKQNLTHEYIESSGLFSVSVLDIETPMTFIGRFGFKSGRDIDKFEEVSYRAGDNGCPLVLEYAVGYFEASVTGKIDVGTHTVYIGELTGAEVLSDGTPMTYADYHLVKGGKSPKTAPTYIGD